MTLGSDNTSHGILQSKLETCTHKLPRPIDLFDPGKVAIQEMCYLDTDDNKSIFSTSWRRKINFA